MKTKVNRMFFLKKLSVFIFILSKCPLCVLDILKDIPRRKQDLEIPRIVCTEKFMQM